MSQKKSTPKTEEFITNSTVASLSDTVRKTILPNGVRVISEYVPTVESFALGVWINAGSRDEDEKIAGMAHFIEHLIFRRTRIRSAKAVAAAFEDIGAYTNAFTTKEHTCFYARSLRKHFRKCSSLLAEIAFQPAFHPADIEKERNVILEEIKGYEDEPEEMIFDEAENRLFAGHSLAHPIAGSCDSVSDIKRQDIIAFYAENYKPCNIVIALAGNIAHKEAAAVATSYFSFDNASSPTKKYRDIPPVAQGGNATMVKSFQQSHIVAATQIEGAASPDRFAYAVMNTVFGDGMSSRLYQRLRERSALAYTVYSNVQLMSDCGTLAVYAGIDERNTAKALRIIGEEIEKLRQSKITPKELARAKEQVKASIVMGLEDMSSRMNYLAKSEIEEGGFEPAETALARTDSVSADDILRIAQSSLSPERIQNIIFKRKE